MAPCPHERGSLPCHSPFLRRARPLHHTAACLAAQVVTLTISNVPGDDPSIIASGPTVADATRCADALSILKRYQIDVSGPVHDSPVGGGLETPKPGDPAFDRTQVHVMATPQQSLQAAAKLTTTCSATMPTATLPARVIW